MRGAHGARHLLRLLAFAPLLALGAALIAVRLRLYGPLSWVRHFNKLVLNRVVLLLAGRRGSPIALVQHRGRRSGRAYATPVIAAARGERVYVALTYGPQTDWCRNVRAAGEAILVAGGVARTVRAPQIAGQAEALPAFPPPARLACRLIGIREFLGVTAGNDVAR